MATVVISVLNNGINLNSSNNFIAIEFNEVVTGFETGDVTVTGATKSTFFAVSDTRYLQRITVGGTPGTISVSIPADAVTPNLDADTSYTFSYDADGIITEITTPTVTIAYDVAKAVSQVATGVTFTWSSTTTAFTASDVSVVNGTLSNFAGSGTTYTADLTPHSGTGTLTTTVAADAVPDSVAVSATLEYAPFTTTITVPTQEVGLMFDITVAFSHVVTDVEVTDFRLRRSDGVFIALNSTNTTITQTPGTNEYTFVITLTGTPDDTFRMRLDANQVAFDSNTYPVVAFTGPTFTIDYTNRDPVTLMISTTNMNIVQNEVVAIDVVFGETITGLTAFDFTVTGGTVGALTGSGDSYVLSVTAGAPGTLTVSLPVGAVLPSNAAVSEDFTIRAVTVVISTTNTHIRLNEVVAIDVMFGETITGLTAFDFTVTGGTVGALTGSGDTYVLSVTAGMVGTLRVTLPAGSVTPSNALTSQDFTINPATNLTIEAIDDQKIPVGSRDYVLVIDIGGDPDSVRPSGDLEGFDHTWDATKGQLSIRAVEVTRLVIGARWIILVSKGTDDFLEGKIYYSVVPVGPVISDPGAQTLYKGFPFNLVNEVANVPTVVRGSALLTGLKYAPSALESGESAILTDGTLPADAVLTEDSFDMMQYAENDGGNDSLMVPVTIANAFFYGYRTTNPDTIYQLQFNGDGEDISEVISFTTDISVGNGEIAVDADYIYVRDSSIVRRGLRNTADGAEVNLVFHFSRSNIFGVAVDDDYIYATYRQSPTNQRVYVRNKSDGSAVLDFRVSSSDSTFIGEVAVDGDSLILGISLGLVWVDKATGNNVLASIQKRVDLDKNYSDITVIGDLILLLDTSNNVIDMIDKNTPNGERAEVLETHTVPSGFQTMAGIAVYVE